MISCGGDTTKQIATGAPSGVEMVPTSLVPTCQSDGSIITDPTQPPSGQTCDVDSDAVGDIASAEANRASQSALARGEISRNDIQGFVGRDFILSPPGKGHTVLHEDRYADASGMLAFVALVRNDSLDEQSVMVNLAIATTDGQSESASAQSLVSARPGEPVPLVVSTGVPFEQVRDVAATYSLAPAEQADRGWASQINFLRPVDRSVALGFDTGRLGDVAAAPRAAIAFADSKGGLRILVPSPEALPGRIEPGGLDARRFDVALGDLPAAFDSSDWDAVTIWVWSAN